ncbi:dihydroxyacid dehydratase/phosphogluconate dehydratase [Paraburkholderia sp. GAS348]
MLKGNLAPNGAVIKPSAATPHLLKHRGRAVVFENIKELHAKIDDESLDIDDHCIMVLKGAGPKGYPGFAEVGNMPLPKKVLQKGITDMVRISDGRAAWQPPATPARGYYKLYVEHVLQADQGADLDFLVGSSGAPVPRDSH